MPDARYRRPQIPQGSARRGLLTAFLSVLVFERPCSDAEHASLGKHALTGFKPAAPGPLVLTVQKEIFFLFMVTCLGSHPSVPGWRQ